MQIPASHLRRGAGAPPGTRSLRLLDRLAARLRALHYSERTVEAYLMWTRRFVLHHGRRHPTLMGAAEVGAFLQHLSNEGRVAAATRNQAYAALQFLYRDLLRTPLEPLGGELALHPVRRPVRLPVVLSVDEVRRLLAAMRGVPRLCATLMYGAGLRVGECVSLRVKDVDRDRRQLQVRAGKGGKDRFVPLPLRALPALDVHLERQRARWVAARDRASVAVPLPGAVDRKSPRAATEWAWQWVFPAARAFALEDGRRMRWHLHESVLQRLVPAAARAAHREARELPHPAALLRDPPPGVGHRHPHHPGAPRPHRPAHDDDLHPRAQPGRVGGGESGGPSVRRGGVTPRVNRGRAVGRVEEAAPPRPYTSPTILRALHGERSQLFAYSPVQENAGSLHAVARKRRGSRDNATTK